MSKENDKRTTIVQIVIAHRKLTPNGSVLEENNLIYNLEVEGDIPSGCTAEVFYELYGKRTAIVPIDLAEGSCVVIDHRFRRSRDRVSESNVTRDESGRVDLITNESFSVAPMLELEERTVKTLAVG